MITLDTSVESVPRIARRIVPALKRLGIKTIRDLLLHFPSRYEDFSNQKPIRHALLNEVVTIHGTIQKISNRRTAKKNMMLTEAIVADDTNTLQALWFNQPFLLTTLKIGNLVSLSGKITLGKDGLCLQNPVYERITPDEMTSDQTISTSIHTGGIIPLYPETEGITSRWLRFLIKAHIDLCKEFIDPLPAEMRERLGFPTLADAIAAIHFPISHAASAVAKKRCIFDQLLLFQLRALKERSRLKDHDAPAIPLNLSLLKEFVNSLPFELTNAQRRSIWEIVQDMTKPQPMNRLLEGDVGSGKTIVAAAAVLCASRAGFQTAFMAPTEILAHQHYETLSRILRPFGMRVGLLTGGTKHVPDNPALLVGTHALIKKDTHFKKLGLVIIDEQHRFGVEQRAQLLARNIKQGTGKEVLPHFLSMTATPIPRTLALTVYGDLDLSILDEMPKSRKQIITRLVAPSVRRDTYDFIRKEVKKGRQIFVICPRIESSNHESQTKNRELKTFQQKKLLHADVKSVIEEYHKLSEEIFPDLRVAMLHGKMKPKEKHDTMQNFRNRQSDILVSTSVIEVGVDISNATIMMIEGAERFGLATIHQFRGRVGRGAEQSYCFLFPTEDSAANRRLQAVIDAKNGFELAEKDLLFRGAGDLFGTQQWGDSSLIIEGLSDPAVVRTIRHEAVELIKTSPDLARYPELRQQLEQFEKTTHLE